MLWLAHWTSVHESSTAWIVTSEPYRRSPLCSGVHESFIYKLLRQRLGRGDIAALLHGGGAQAKLNGDQLMILANLVAASPDAPLERAKFEMRQKTLPVEKLVFVDEFGANIAMPPLTPDLHKESAQKSASRSTRWAASRPPAL